jgi:hypothetical protein
MPKNLFQDMVKVKRMKQEGAHTPLREESPRVEQKETIKIHHIASHKKEVRLEPHRGRRGKPRTPWLVALISVLFFFFALSLFFSKAEVTINPKVKDVTLNENLSAVKDASNDNDLPFDLVVISGQEDKAIEGGELKDVSVTAKGTVVIYNAFSSVAQKLAIDTRLEGSNGKMYKTVKAITVPGMKGATPGSIEVGLYASDAGDAYNSAPLDFKIFGFKGTTKYTKFYGRSKGSIAGGLKGKLSIVSDSQKADLEKEMKTALQAQLLGKALSQTPEGFVLFKNAAFLNIDGESFDSPTHDSRLVASVKGTLYGVLFDEKKLTNKIVKNNMPDYDGSEVYIPNVQDLVFSMPSGVDASGFNNLQNINFNLSGAARIVYKVDKDKLVSDLLGRAKKDFNLILSTYPNIDSANLNLSPFWKMSLPGKSKSIEVIVNYP